MTLIGCLPVSTSVASTVTVSPSFSSDSFTPTVLVGDAVKVLPSSWKVLEVSRPGLAHNDWGLPLVGGLVGGYALSGMIRHAERPRETVVTEPVYAAPPAPVYIAPAAPAAPTASTIEHQLNVLYDLAAKGYITQSEYQARRQALLDQL
jgi:hypothetical protein